MAKDKGQEQPKEKTCLIIMPISTSEFLLPRYRDDKNHFKHVLECLLLPAVSKAGYVSILPAAKGADLIHAEIVSNLDAADLVLCDMSGLNPNVFFEFGIRTALNKPVCIVKDDVTEKVPFDMGILNYVEYRSALAPWTLAEDIEKITDHLTVSAERSRGMNTMWRHFGLRAQATAVKGEGGAEAKMDYMIGLMEQVMRARSSDSEIPLMQDVHKVPIESKPSNVALTLGAVEKLLSPTHTVVSVTAHEDARILDVAYSGKPLGATREADIIVNVTSKYGWDVVLRRTNTRREIRPK